MAPTRTLEDLPEAELEGRRVLVRVDYNVPLKGGAVSDAMRIDATLPTLRHLLGARARVVLVSHLGRPDGEEDPAFSLAPVAAALADRIGADVPLLSEPVGSVEMRTAVEAVEPGRAVLLENIRFHPGETRNDPEFARSLAELGEIYVGEAFGAAHRAHASTVGAAEAIREKGGAVVAGYLMERELRFLREAIREPTRPFVAVLGGAKISGKIDLIEAILPKVDRILVGGAMANTFFRALGLDTGDSLVEEDRVELAEDLLDRAGDRLLLPVDVMVASRIDDDARPRSIERGEVAAGDRIGDIGPVTRALFAEELEGARTILWNGPMGVFEAAPFAEGTVHVARAIAEAADGGAVAVIGGGDSVSAAEIAGVSARMTHISTGGGASLDLLAGKELPGVAVLDEMEEGR